MVEYDFRAAYAFLHSGVSTFGDLRVLSSSIFWFCAYFIHSLDFMNFLDLNYDELLVWPFLARAVFTARGPASASEEAVTSDCSIYCVFPHSGVLPAWAGRTAVSWFDSKERHT